MPEVLSSLLSAVKPRLQLAKREVESASRFVLDEAKFFAVIGARANGSFDERDDAEYDLPKVLIRAGRRALELFREGNSSGAVEEDVALSLLAKHLVVLAKEGMTEEGPLVAAGLRFLISLTASPSSSISDDEDGANESLGHPLEFCIEGANAKFLLQWRIPWS